MSEFKDLNEKEAKNNNLDEVLIESSAKELSIASTAKVISPGKMVLRRFFKSKLSIIGLVTLLLLFIFSFIGPLLSPYGEVELSGDYKWVVSVLPHKIVVSEINPDTGLAEDVVYNFSEVSEPYKVFTKTLPSWEHIFGTDQYGYDVLTRLMYGGRVSLLLGFIVIFSEVIVGVFFGSLAGYFGRWVDQVVMRTVDVFICLPGLPILLLAASLIDSWGVPARLRIYYLMGILTFFGWSGFARLARGQILGIRELEYMLAAEATGLSTKRKIFKHILPNIMPQIIVSATLGLGGIILTESTLSYLGLGIPFPYAAWGTMISSTSGAAGRDILQNYPGIWVPAGVCIVLAVLAFNFVGDGLRDAFDPKMKR